MHPPGADIVVVRHGEIGVKSDQVRRKMESRLAGNIQALLADRDVEGEVERRRTRLYVHAADVEAATDAVTDAPGVVSASPATVVEPTREAIFEAFADATRARYDGGPFAVRARRAGDEEAHPFSSRDLEEDGGARVWQTIEAMGHDPEVDLDDPAFEVFVECREQQAYVFLERVDGPGGLPVGTQRPVVALISGGIDSPVAAWELLRRGTPVRPLYVDLGQYGGPDHRARAVATVADLSRYVPNVDLDLRVLPAGEVVEDLVAETDETRMLHLRRFMLAAAEAVAERENAVGVVTGEAVGQKSSQTSANLAVTDAAVDLPVHRPNLTTDKSDITQQARDLGTFAESTIPTGCNRVAPSFPETNADLAAVREAEPDDLLDRAHALAADVEVIPVEGREPSPGADAAVERNP